MGHQDGVCVAVSQTMNRFALPNFTPINDRPTLPSQVSDRPLCRGNVGGDMRQSQHLVEDIATRTDINPKEEGHTTRAAEQNNAKTTKAKEIPPQPRKGRKKQTAEEILSIYSKPDGKPNLIPLVDRRLSATHQLSNSTSNSPAPGSTFTPVSQLTTLPAQITDWTPERAKAYPVWPKAEAKLPIKPFRVSPSLSKFQITRDQFLKSNQDLHRIATGGMIFHKDCILLVRRAAHEWSWAGCWEIPGGSVDFGDPTILHGTAREILEETGLHVTRVNHQVGQGLRFNTSPTKSWIKFAFDVDVEEAYPALGRTDNHIKTCVQLDPNEHQAWLWATEEEVSSQRVQEEDIHLPMISQVQKEVMLEGFAMRRAMKQFIGLTV